MATEFLTTQHARMEAAALKVWQRNDRGNYMVPHPENYPWQWLWDSAFHAIGMRHRDLGRAAVEVASVLDGQWENGMVPNVQYHERGGAQALIWQLARNPNMPRGVATSGVTQPPVLADAVWQVGECMPPDERRDFLRAQYRPLVRYHEWLYRGRTLGDDDHLIGAKHPWETGMDNKMPLMEHSAELDWGGWLPDAIARISQMFRRDTRLLDIGERSSADEGRLQALALISMIGCGLDDERLRDEHPLHYRGVGFNSIFVRNNTVLGRIADEIGQPLPDELSERMSATRDQMELMWNERDQTYYSLDREGYQIESQTLSSLMPLYAGVVAGERRKRLITDMLDPEKFWTGFGLPNTPLDHPRRRPDGYWQEIWINTNYMGVKMLDENGHPAEARVLADRTLDLIYSSGNHEYYNALDGRGLGVRDFGWTAMLALELADRR